MENGQLGLARYSRPSDLEGYIGNEKIKDTFTRIVGSGAMPQSMLLMGNTGCGKTTLARIISSWYMCESPNEDGSPCNECETCKLMQDYVKTGNFEYLPDITEVDVTDKSGKSDMDSILESFEHRAYGKWKVYIFDECHAMSVAASNRILKVLEEPPEDVLLLFCTTDPQKMLDTVRNRCQQKFTVEKPTTNDLCKLLARVCTKEGKEFDLNGLRMICSKSDNVIRDSLNNLETVLLARGGATGNLVAEQFEQVTDAIMFEFYKAYLAKNYVAYINLMYKVKTTVGFKQFIRSLTTFTTRGIYVLSNVNVEGLTKEELKCYSDLFKRFEVNDIADVLKTLQVVDRGDIESNLMSFIYKKEEKPNVVVVDSSTNNTKVSSPDSESRAVDIEDLRKSNLADIDAEKLKKGLDVSEHMGKVGFDDISGFFNLQETK